MFILVLFEQRHIATVSKILVTGGTGTLGKVFTKILDERNAAYLILSRSNQSGSKKIVVGDLLNNQGVAEALKEIDIIIHLATDFKRDVVMTQNLLNSIDKKSNVHLVYISIVGIDKVPFSYYKQKLASENAIKSSGISFTILRATQFHEFIYQIISTFLKFPIGFLPKRIVSQPIQIEIVANELLKISQQPAADKTLEIGGIKNMTLQQMATEWMQLTGKKKWVLNLPILGELGKAFYNGSLTTANRRKESITWKQWLSQHLCSFKPDA